MNLVPKHFPVTCHTKHVGPGSTFVAISGNRCDGAHFIEQAIERGAVKIVHALSCHIEKQPGIVYEAVDNPRQALAKQAADALDNPAKKLKLIGITGTKGKTTTAYLIHHILHASGKSAALLSTIANKIGHQEEPSTLTTPSSDYLNMFFKVCVDQGIEYVVMEVSSHALSMDRVHGLRFDVACFTNLAPEHLDFYTSMDEYGAAKLKLFTLIKPSGASIVNVDDQYGATKVATCSHAAQVITYGTKKLPLCHPRENGDPVNTNLFSGSPISRGRQKEHSSSLTYTHITKIMSAMGSMQCRVRLPGQLHSTMFHLPHLFGRPNAYNLTTALLVCQHIGLSISEMEHALMLFQGVPGRQQMITLKNGALALVDYAHNPSSMLAMVRSLRLETNHLIVVFGCGGDRDPTKRPTMGRQAAAWADIVILTNDNPRSEDPMHIINEIMSGIPQKRLPNVIIMPDRRTAIEHAVQLAHPHSIIAILGKGHEQTQQDSSGIRHFSDLEVVQRC